MVKGQAQIEVKFDINGSKLTVIAVDKLTGNSKNLTNPNDKNLSKLQIDRLVVEEEQYKKEDNLVSKGIENENTWNACKNLIQEKVEEVITWYNNNPNDFRSQFESKIREFISVLNPQ